jgi:hypothetical protein
LQHSDCISHSEPLRDIHKPVLAECLLPAKQYSELEAMIRYSLLRSSSSFKLLDDASSQKHMCQLVMVCSYNPST